MQVVYYNKKKITRWLADMNFIFVLKAIFYLFVKLVRKILFSPLEDKINILIAPPYLDLNFCTRWNQPHWNSLFSLESPPTGKNGTRRGTKENGVQSAAQQSRARSRVRAAEIVKSLDRGQRVRVEHEPPRCALGGHCRGEKRSEANRRRDGERTRGPARGGRERGDRRTAQEAGAQGDTQVQEVDGEAERQTVNATRIASVERNETTKSGHEVNPTCLGKKIILFFFKFYFLWEKPKH